MAQRTLGRAADCDNDKMNHRPFAVNSIHAYARRLGKEQLREQRRTCPPTSKNRLRLPVNSRLRSSKAPETQKFTQAEAEMFRKFGSPALLMRPFLLNYAA